VSRAEEFAERVQVVKRSRTGWMALCPAHDDSRPSLSISEGRDGRVLLHCHAGCSVHDILAALEIPMSTLFGEPHVVAEYAYHGPDGDVRYVVERWEPKDFRIRQPDGRRQAPPTEAMVLYNLAGIAVARENGWPVVLVEGERDVETLRANGIVATTAQGGAAKEWLPQYGEALRDLDVVIVADADKAGRKLAKRVRDALEGAANKVTLMEPGRAGCKDVTDLYEAGGSLRDLKPMSEVLGLTTMAKDYRPEKVQWLWDRRIPVGMLTLLEGDPGTGKSTLIIDLIGRLTTGRPLPGHEIGGEPVTVAMLSEEDHWPAVVVPRLIAAGADLGRVIRMQGVPTKDGLVPYSLSELPTLRNDLQVHGASVLVIDPIMAYLGGTDVNSYSDHHVRMILGPMSSMAEEDDLTVIAVRHFTKSDSGRAIHKGGGSIGFIGQARSVLQTGRHPEAEEMEDRYCLAVAKNNLTARATTLGYKMVAASPTAVPHIEFETLPVPHSADSLLKHDPMARSQERAFLREIIEASSSKLLRWAEIVKLGNEAGFKEHTLRNARDGFLYKINPPGGSGARDTMWGLHPQGQGHYVFGDVADNVIKFPDRAGEEGEPRGKVAQQIDTTSTECAICGRTALTVDAVNGARCAEHNPDVWKGN
jgi:5S rRNA maturation endonuclease (ribonuclease M5)